MSLHRPKHKGHNHDRLLCHLHVPILYDRVGRSRYWRRLWSSDDFVGQPLANCVEIIHADIVGSWNFPDKDKYVSSTEFKAEISYLVQDLTGSPISTPSRYRLNGTPGTGAAWLNGRYENSNENICLVMGYIVDLTIILCGVFGNVSPSVAQSVIDNFANSTHKTSIHSDISSFIRTVPQFQYYDNDVVMAKIIDLISRNCDPPPGNGTK
ncbi:hypothetical protein BGY98DRAFT_736470 [Russula aff. rugulosa BPL654]|nr:hypothetical protein BGY98DRAFT_736470 [Russula aff. rugulosa BPL654]